MFYADILQSTRGGRCYIGHTSIIGERLMRHNTGNVKTTKNKGSLVNNELQIFETKAEANSRELNIKSMKNRQFIEKLIFEFKKNNS